MPSKMHRLEARVTKDLKVLLQRAANIEGRSVTDFVVNAVREAATRTVERAEVIRLSARDQRMFAEGLLQPYAPSRRLRQAATRYKKIATVAK